MIKGDKERYKILKEKTENATIIYEELFEYVENYSNDKIQERLISVIKFMLINIDEEKSKELLGRIVTWP